MAKNNSYLAKIQNEKAVLMQVTERITRQLMLDCTQIVLNREFGFGYDRLKKLADLLMEAYDQYHDAADGGVEADYWQEKLDRALLDIIQDKQPLIPFKQRYPEIKEIRYDKRR